MATKEEILFDVRVVEHHIRRRETSKNDYQTWLDALPDDAEHGEPTLVTFSNSRQAQDAADEA